MKEKLGLNTWQFICLCVSIVLTLFCAFETFVHFGADVPKSSPLLKGIIYVLLAYYAFYGYKIPHGNLLRYIMVFFALTLVDDIGLVGGGRYTASIEDSARVLYLTIGGVVVVIVSYIAGRLNKFDKNIKLFVVALLLLLVKAFVISGFKTLMWTTIGDIVLLNDINVAYSIRYVQHKAAGLEDK